MGIVNNAEDEPDWKGALVQFLKGATRILVLGVGNPIRGDDGAGSYVATLVGKKHASSKMPILGISGGSAPENFLSPCLKYSPSHLLIVDAADMSSAKSQVMPGSICQIPLKSLFGLSFSSHRMPLGIIVDFFRNEGIRNVMVLGIQPRSLDLGSPMSDEVRKASLFLARTIVSIARMSITRAN